MYICMCVYIYIYMYNYACTYPRSQTLGLAPALGSEGRYEGEGSEATRPWSLIDGRPRRCRRPIIMCVYACM